MARLHFSKVLLRPVRFIGYHHVLMFINVIAIILLSTMLAGCSSYSAMTDVYILGLSYTNSTTNNLDFTEKNLFETLSSLKGSSHLEVRIGYFGMCVRQRGVVWLCSADSDGLAEQIGSKNDPLNLIGMASKFRDDVLFSGLLFMAIVLSFLCLMLLASFPGWHEERNQETGSQVDVKPIPSRPVSRIALSCSFVAAMCSLTASLWQHVGSVGAAAMAESANYGNVKSYIGAGAMSMTWISFGLLAIVSAGLATIILSIMVLDRLVND